MGSCVQGKLGVPGLPGYPGRQGPKVSSWGKALFSREVELSMHETLRWRRYQTAAPRASASTLSEGELVRRR